MKMWKKCLTAFLAAALLFVPSMEGLAAEDTYKVTISSGVQGRFADGSDKLVYDVAANTTLEFTASENVTLNADEDGNPSKYYIKGVRLSGRDDEAIYTTLSENIDGHADYVVVYGIKGQQVEYTVKYVDKNGKKLAEDDVFYGNIGDKPVVACKYIEGYAPQAFALEKTLAENSAENVFTFVYGTSTITYFHKTTQHVDGGTVTVYVPGPAVTTAGGAGGAGGAGAAGGVGQGTAEEPEAETETEENVPGVEAEEEEMPEEIIDLDDEETPLANIDLDEVKEGLPMAGIVAIAAGSLGVLAALVAFLMKKKRNATIDE